MDEQCQGVIVRVRPMTETSLVVHWMTQDKGRVATVAKGARKQKSPFSGRLDLYCEGRFSFVRSRRSSLHTLREVDLSARYIKAASDMLALRVLAHATRLVEWSVEEDTPAPGLAGLFQTLLAALEAGHHGLIPMLRFEADLLDLLGALGEDESIRAVQDCPPERTLDITILRSAASRLGVYLTTELGRKPENRLALLRDLRPPETKAPA